ncbi:MAG: ATP-binding protein [bacterium]
MTRPVSRPSLRTELLIDFGILATAALLFAVATTVLLHGRVEPRREVLYLALVIAADVSIVAIVAAHMIDRCLVRPLREVNAATEKIAAGSFVHRLQPHASLELDRLAENVNRLAERLVDEQALLASAEQRSSVSELAASLAKELGNPLVMLNGFGRSLRAQNAGNQLALDAVAGMERETARIDRVVRALHDYARPSQPAQAPIDVNASLRHVVDLLSAQGVLRRMELRLELANETPHVLGERDQLEQLLANLVLNASQAVEGIGTVAIRTTCIARADLEAGMVRAGDAPGAMVPHPPSPSVRRWLQAEHPPEEVVKIVVADSGPGVPVENRERIFDPFFTTSEPGQGTGLGLAIAQRIVESFQGIVWVQPAREGGAAFHVLLPLAASGTDVRVVISTTAPFPALA